MDTQTLACFSRPAHTHAQIQTSEQIKAYPPTVVVDLQDDEGLDPKYQLISTDQWLTSQPARARLTNTTQLKAQPKALLQAACWILYQSNDSPQKPRLCQLVSSLFSLLLSLGLCHYFFCCCCHCLKLYISACVNEGKAVCFGNESKAHKRAIFLEEQGVNFNILLRNYDSQCQ